HEAASRTGVSFYEFHARQVEREADEARAAGTLKATIDEKKDVEYPPLALAVMRLPALGMRGEVVDTDMPDRAKPRYYFLFHAGMAVVDGALLALIVMLSRRLFPCGSQGDLGRRLLVYVASTMLLWHLLYDRLDLILAALVLF